MARRDATAPHRPPGLDEECLQELAGRRAPRGAGISLFVDLDPERFATAPARDSQLTSLFDEAHRRIEEEAREHETLKELRRSLDAARSALAEDGVFEGPHGLGVFAGFYGARAEAEIVPLPGPVAPEVAIDDAPLVRPLLRSRSEGSWAVALVSREEGRIFTGDEWALSLRGDVHDEIRGQHDQGGWSQARYERSIEKEARRHLDGAASASTRHASGSSGSWQQGGAPR